MATGNATNTPKLTTNGFVMIGSTGSFPVAASLTAPSSGFSITGGAGSITFALNDDLAALEALASTGFAVRSASSAWVQRAVAVGSTKISVSNADGVAGNPTLDVVEANLTLDSIGGTLSVNKGGTGTTSLTDGGIVLGSGTAAVTVTGQPTSGQLLIGSTGFDPALNSLTAPASGFSITGGAASITFALTDDLGALEALASTGIAVRSGASTWVQRSVAAGSTKISVSNGDGVAGNPTLDVVESNLTLDSIGGTLSVSKGGTGATTLTDHGVLLGSGTGAVTPTSVGTDGQVLIGSSAADPVFNSLTQPAAGLTIVGGAGSVTFALANDLAALEALGGTGIAVRSGVSTWVQRGIVNGSAKISVTNGDGVAGNISIDTTISGFTWVVNTLSTRQLAAYEAVICNNVSVTVCTLPSTAAVGDEIRVVDYGGFGFQIAQNAGEFIYFNSKTTTVGVGGSLQSTSAHDAIHIVCVEANNGWLVVDSSGNFTIV